MAEIIGLVASVASLIALTSEPSRPERSSEVGKQEEQRCLDDGINPKAESNLLTQLNLYARHALVCSCLMVFLEFPNPSYRDVRRSDECFARDGEVAYPFVGLVSHTAPRGVRYPRASGDVWLTISGGDNAVLAFISRTAQVSYPTLLL